MGKIEKNMYVRTKNGIIFKYYPCRNNEYDEELNIYSEWDDDGRNYDCYTIANASKNIIDLIEVGDILLIKDFADEACMIFNDMYYIQNENQLFNIKRDLEKNKNMKISKILTKEQYENNCYKVDDK